MKIVAASERVSMSNDPATKDSRKGRSRTAPWHRMLPATDLRSAPARRFRFLIGELSRHLADGEPLSVLEDALVKQAAGCILQSEKLQAAVVTGGAVDTNAIVRLTNASARILTAIAKLRDGKPKHAAPTLAEHFARKRALAFAE